MENISFCPYRTNWAWSTLQTTIVTQPLVFQGNANDLRLLEACKKLPEEPEKPVADATPGAGKPFIIWTSSIRPSMNTLQFKPLNNFSIDIPFFILLYI
jgi:hypothetical protein